MLAKHLKSVVNYARIIEMLARMPKFAINTNYGSRQQKELKMEQLNDETFEECCLDTTSQNVKTYFCVFRKKVLFRFGSLILIFDIHHAECLQRFTLQILDYLN